VAKNLPRVCTLQALDVVAGHAGGLSTSAPLAAQMMRLPKRFKQHVVWIESYNINIHTTYNFTISYYAKPVPLTFFLRSR